MELIPRLLQVWRAVVHSILDQVDLNAQVVDLITHLHDAVAGFRRHRLHPLSGDRAGKSKARASRARRNGDELQQGRVPRRGIDTPWQVPKERSRVSRFTGAACPAKLLNLCIGLAKRLVDLLNALPGGPGNHDFLDDAGFLADNRLFMSWPDAVIDELNHSEKCLDRRLASQDPADRLSVRLPGHALRASLLGCRVKATQPVHLIQLADH